jgi:hypothetical protein
MNLLRHTNPLALRPGFWAKSLHHAARQCRPQLRIRVVQSTLKPPNQIDLQPSHSFLVMKFPAALHIHRPTIAHTSQVPICVLPPVALAIALFAFVCIHKLISLEARHLYTDCFLPLSHTREAKITQQSGLLSGSPGHSMLSLLNLPLFQQAPHTDNQLPTSCCTNRQPCQLLVSANSPSSTLPRF